jgi:hypothetical protein
MLIYFYYVVSSATSSIHTIGRDTEYWQAIWDDEDRSSRQSLKRDITNSTIANEPPSKRQRQASPGPIEPPKTFKDALHMIVASWKMTYPKLNFPLKLIVFFPTKKAPLVTTKHNVTPEGTKLVRDIELTTGQHAGLKKERVITCVQKCGLALRKNENERFETWIENELALVIG